MQIDSRTRLQFPHLRSSWV
uniref:Uncharacterized protein n=1 Tax=Rhizophora mucronata TaxID=61149 RepID=A0A2P2J6P9_RHIMU